MNYNLQLKADALNQQLESLKAQKSLLEEQLKNSPQLVQNNYIPAQTQNYEFYGEYVDDIYNVRNINEKVIYMDKNEPVFMMKGQYYKFEEFDQKSEIQKLREENEQLKKELKEKQNESIVQNENKSNDGYGTIPLEI